MELWLALLGQLAILGGFLGSAWLLARRVWEPAGPGERLVGAGVLFFGMMSLAGQALGFLGALSLGWALVAAVGVAMAAAWAAGGAAPDPARAWTRGTFWIAGACGVAGLLAFPFWTRALFRAPVAWDSLTYHLFFPARWIAEGRIFLIQAPFPYDNRHSYFPANVESFLAMSMVGLRNDFYAELFSLPFIALDALAVGCLALRLGSTREGAWAAGLLIVTTPALLGYGATEYVEPYLNLCLLAALLWSLPPRPKNGSSFAAPCEPEGDSPLAGAGGARLAAEPTPDPFPSTSETGGADEGPWREHLPASRSPQQDPLPAARKGAETKTEPKLEQEEQERARKKGEEQERARKKGEEQEGKGLRPLHPHKGLRPLTLEGFGARRAAWVGWACGLAAGSKFFALYFVGFLGLVWMLRQKSRRLALGVGLAFALAALLGGGAWYVRNGLLRGNPFYPVPFGPLAGCTEELDWSKSPWSELPDLLRSGLWRSIWVGEPGLVRSQAALGWKFWILAPLALAGLGFLAARLSSALRRREQSQALLHGLPLAAAAVFLYTYLSVPSWGHLDWLQVNIRFSIPFWCVAIAAAAAGVSRLPQGGRLLVGLALAGMLMDSRFLDLRLQAPPASFWALGLLALPAHLLRRRAGWLAWSLLATAVIAEDWIPRREAERYTVYREQEEVHHSMHRDWAPAAEFLQARMPGRRLAVAVSGWTEFLYLFVGPRFERTVLHVPPESRPRTCADRPPLDRNAWLRRLRESGAELFLAARRQRELDWPAESFWAKQLGFRLLFQDASCMVFAVPKPGG